MAAEKATVSTACASLQNPFAPLDHALRDRGTIKEVRRRSGGHPNHFAVRVDFRLRSGATGHYSFQVAAKESGRFEVKTEECRFIDLAAGLGENFYRVERGRVIRSSLALAPAAFSDRLYLVAASGLAEFRPLYDALSGMEIYNLNPKEIAAMQKPDAGELLRRDGSNAASVFHKLPARRRTHFPLLHPLRCDRQLWLRELQA